MDGQIVDATVIEARRPRLNAEEKVIVRGGGTPSDWSKARIRQIDRNGRWKIKRGRTQAPPPDDAAHPAGDRRDRNACV
jgi:transposase, IS5 family